MRPHSSFFTHLLPFLTSYRNSTPAVQYFSCPNFLSLFTPPLNTPVFLTFAHSFTCRYSLKSSAVPYHPPLPCPANQPPLRFSSHSLPPAAALPLIALDVPYSRRSILLLFLYLSLISSQISHKHYFLVITKFPFLAR